MSRSPAPPPPREPAPERAGDRIAKLLARAGIASRREVERMIAEGRVALDGTVVDTPATVLHSLAGVTVDGQAVAAPAPARLFLYHKPVGLLVTERDPAGRPTIYDRLPAELPRVVPVGRLDLATEGLLLLTTDGGLKRQLELPSTGVERTYRARAYGEVSQAALEDLSEGIEIDGIRYGSIDANLERRTGANAWIEMTLTEGKNREVRRVLEHLGLQVGRLIRTRYGPFVLADLPPGEVGEVRQHDLIAFRQVLNGRPQAASTLPVTVVPVTVSPARAARPMPGDEPAGRTDRAPSSRTERPKPAADQSRQRPARPGSARGGVAARKEPGTAEQRDRPALSGGDRKEPDRQRAFGQSQGSSPRPPRTVPRAADGEHTGRRGRERHVRSADTDAGQHGRSRRAENGAAGGAPDKRRSSSQPGRSGDAAAGRPIRSRAGGPDASGRSDDRRPGRDRADSGRVETPRSAHGSARPGDRRPPAPTRAEPGRSDIRNPGRERAECGQAEMARPARGPARPGDRKPTAPTRAEPGGKRPMGGRGGTTPAPGGKPDHRGPPRRPR